MFGLSRTITVKFTVILAGACTGLLAAAASVVLVYFVLEPAALVEWPVFTLAAVFIILMLSVCASGAVFWGYWLSRRLVRELGDLAHGVRLLADGKLNFRWKEQGVRETLDIRRQLNRLADKWEREIELLQSIAEEKEELAQQAHEAGVIAERQRLARELHDAVSQQLFALSMTAAATARLAECNPKSVKEKAQLIETMAHQALLEMRALLMHLRPVCLETQTLVDAIAGLLDELEAKAIVKTELQVQADVRLSKSTEVNLFRIVQEAIANTLRHGKASLLCVKLAADEDVVRLSIEDDGVGFDLNAVSCRKVSYGLRTMRERAEECGGTLNLVTLPGMGTRVHVQVPRISRKGEISGG